MLNLCISFACLSIFTILILKICEYGKPLNLLNYFWDLYSMPYLFILYQYFTSFVKIFHFLQFIPRLILRLLWMVLFSWFLSLCHLDIKTIDFYVNFIFWYITGCIYHLQESSIKVFRVFYIHTQIFWKYGCFLSSPSPNYFFNYFSH